MAEFARERITVDSTIKMLTVSNTLAYTAAHITVEDEAVRFTIDGTDPVGGSIGHELSAGDVLILQDIFELQGFKVTRDSSDAVLEVSYKRS